MVSSNNIGSLDSSEVKYSAGRHSVFRGVGDFLMGLPKTRLMKTLEWEHRTSYSGGGTEKYGIDIVAIQGKRWDPEDSI